MYINHHTLHPKAQTISNRTPNKNTNSPNSRHQQIPHSRHNLKNTNPPISSTPTPPQQKTTHKRRNNTRRHPILQKIHIRQIKHPKLIHLRRSRLIREPRHRHPHPSRTDQARQEDQQVRSIPRETRPNLFRDGHEEDAGDGMADKRRHDL